MNYAVGIDPCIRIIEKFALSCCKYIAWLCPRDSIPLRMVDTVSRLAARLALRPKYVRISRKINCYRRVKGLARVVRQLYRPRPIDCDRLRARRRGRQDSLGC